MLEKIEQIKKIKQNYYPIFFQQEYGINDVGIFLLKLIKIIKRVLLVKISFPNITFSKGFKKSSLVIGVFIFLCILYYLVWNLPKIQVIQNPSIEKKDELTVEDKVRSTWINAIGGLGLFVTAYFAWRNSQISHKQLIATQDKLELDKNKTKKDLELLEDKQITERFVKAVEQLGDKDSIIVCLGGIYSLERIAKERASTDGYISWTIMQLLTAFIREKSSKDIDVQKLTDKLNKDTNEQHDLSQINNLHQDVQTALTVIGKRETGGVMNPAQQLNFRECKLNKANLYMAKLHYFTFCGAELQEAYLHHANLYHAELTQANLQDADLENAMLDISSLKKANLKNARLKNASLLGADLTEADLSGADIENTNFCDHDPYHDDCRTKITVDQILKAKNWDKAHYSPEFEKKLQLYLFSELKIAEFLRLTLSENSFSIYFINLLRETI
jgi:uncharacterized protein YjbI with pentapeptide repeats